MKIKDYYGKYSFIGFILALIYWITSALVHVYSLNKGNILDQLIIINIDKPENLFRFLVVLMIISLGLYIQLIISKKNNLEGELETRLKYEKIISNISQLGIREKKTDIFFPKSLRLLGEGTETSRVYIFKSEQEKGTMSNIYEWTAPGITSQINNLQDIPETEFSWWMDKLKNREIISYKNIDNIPEEKTKNILKEQNIKSLLVLPIYIGNRYWGFIGFDECLQFKEWSEEDITILQFTTNIFSRYILRNIQEEMIWQENQRFKALVNSIHDVVFELDLQQRHRAIYGKWLEKDDLKPELFLGKNARDIYGKEFALVHETANSKALAGQDVVYEWNIEYNNDLRYYQTSLSAIRDKNGEVTGIVGIGREITSLKKLQQNLEEEKELIHVTFESIGDGIVTTDKNGNVKLLNMVAQQITGWSEEEARGKTFSDVFILTNEMTGKPVDNPVARVFRTGKIIGLANHTILITRDGKHIPIADSAAPIKDEKGELYGVVMVFRDISEERKQQKNILYISYHDHLTGLYNRRFIEEEITRLDTPRQLPISIIMGDVNGLKIANDAFGHSVGDKLLIKTANIIKEVCRQEDIAARWGGDEFLIVLPQTNGNTAEEVVQRIRNKCLDSIVKSIKLNMSLGFAVKTRAEDNIQQTVKEAEEWMYRKKLLQGKSYRKNIINTMMATLHEKSQETNEHVERLKKYCVKLGKSLKLSSKELDDLVLLATLHDIGKTSININILNKPEKLTQEEWKEIKKHPEIGYNIVKNIPELSYIADYIFSHHERWDGKGYPMGLKGKDIPLLSRILAIVDAYDAMINDRIYRKARNREEVIAELYKNAGTQFDPEITKVFCSII
jgi:diguanylate cyclase